MRVFHKVSWGTVERLQKALSYDNKLATFRADVASATKGHTQAYLNALGLTKMDLKKLERAGFAVRGYQPTPQGNRVVWLIVMDNPTKETA